MKAVVLALSLVCAYGPVATPSAEARRLLRSPALRDRAWGAWYAGTSHDPSLQNLIVAKLRAAQPMRHAGRNTEQYAYIQALFDALIQIPGPIPNDFLFAYDGSWRTEILILLSRQPGAPGNETELLALRERSIPDPDWIAVNDLLYAAGSRAFFQKALEEIRITHTFVLTDQPVAFCGGSVGCGESMRRWPKGFPPIALYQFWASMTKPGDSVLLLEPIPTYYRRIVIPTDGEAKWSECTFHPASEPPRQQFLADFLSKVKELSPAQSFELFHPRTTIAWKSPEQASGDMEASLAAQAGSIRELIENARKRGLLKVSEVRLPIQTRIEDVRKDRSASLPTVSSRDVAIP
jgi:hypothetical protein